MFITKPIAKFEYKDNTLTINESAFKFNKSVDDLELIESLISKGAYASALLYLNKIISLPELNAFSNAVNL